VITNWNYYVHDCRSRRAIHPSPLPSGTMALPRVRLRHRVLHAQPMRISGVEGSAKRAARPLTSACEEQG